MITNRGVRPLLGMLAVCAAIPCLAVSAKADPTARNLEVTATVRTQLVTAGAAFKGLPASDFTGLASGQTFYAVDLSTGNHWAGARLVPRPDAPTAQIADQDAGSYLLFQQPPTGTWSAVDDGVTRGPGCPAPLPTSVLALWGWDPRLCRPVSRP